MRRLLRRLAAGLLLASAPVLAQTGSTGFVVLMQGHKAGAMNVVREDGGRVKVAPEGGRLGAVEEGFLFFTGRGNENRFERMRAPDYADWQTWIRSWYEKKDDFEAQSHENDVKRRKASQKEET